jgi:hypothetical protein
MASIKFFIPASTQIHASSGLGLYGSSFGNSVAVGEYQQTTFITSPDGTALGPQGNNVKFVNAQSGIVGSSSSGINIKAIPNTQSTVNIRFENDTAVKTQNINVKIYDRTNINSPASGVTTKVAEIIHVGATQVTTGSSGNVVWSTFASATGTLVLGNGPGSGGNDGGGGGNTVQAEHDWYLAVSASPDSIGSKTQYGLYISLEYL